MIRLLFYLKKVEFELKYSAIYCILQKEKKPLKSMGICTLFTGHPVREGIFHALQS